ncbi:MAG: VWA domain-containing protein [Leptospiraceae bacterium]|nr:VWA domain-containing protein [Leptospiraceae bacterium]
MNPSILQNYQNNFIVFLNLFFLSFLSLSQFHCATTKINSDNDYIARTDASPPEPLPPEYSPPDIGICKGKIEQSIQKNENKEYTIFLIDQSGSMEALFSEDKSRMEVAKDLLIDEVRKLNTGKDTADFFGIYSFGANGCNCIEEIQSPFHSFDKESVVAKIQLLQPSYGTPIATSLEIMEELLTDKQGKFHITLISDGLESCEGNCVEAVSRLSTLKNVQFDTVYVEVVIAGIDLNDSDEEELKALSYIAKTDYIPIKNISDFKNLVSNRNITSNPIKPYCSITNLPQELIQNCYDQYVVIDLKSKRKKDLYYSLLLNYESWFSRDQAYTYFRNECPLQPNSIQEILENKLQDSNLLNFEGGKINDTLEKIKRCEMD